MHSFSVVLYAVSAVYFAGVMVRLMLTLTPVVCVLSAIAFSATFDIYLDDKEKLSDGKKEESVNTSKKSNDHDTGKKKKRDKDREKDRDLSDMVSTILSLSHTLSHSLSLSLTLSHSLSLSHSPTLSLTLSLSHSLTLSLSLSLTLTLSVENCLACLSFSYAILIIIYSCRNLLDY